MSNVTNLSLVFRHSMRKNDLTILKLKNLLSTINFTKYMGKFCPKCFHFGAHELQIILQKLSHNMSKNYGNQALTIILRQKIISLF